MVDAMVDTMVDAVVGAMVGVMVDTMVEEHRSRETVGPKGASATSYLRSTGLEVPFSCNDEVRPPGLQSPRE